MFFINFVYKILIIIVLIIFCFKVTAQTFPIQKYSVQQGIAHSNVFKIFQDNKGFLWFCTVHGLSRFNGKEFRNFTRESGLNNNTNISLMQLPNEKIWINGFSGVNVLSNDSITSWSSDKIFNSSKCISSLLFEGDIWLIRLVQGNELLKIHQGIIHKIAILDENGLEIKFSNIYKDSHKRLLLTSDVGLHSYDIKTGFKRVFKEIINEKVYDIIKDYSNNYWVCLENRIIEIKNGKISFTYYLPKNLLPGHILADSYNNIWVSIPQLGIVLIKNHVAEDITEKLGIGKIIINDLFEDREKNIWIATHGDGVYRLNSTDILNYPVEKDKLNVYAKTIIKDDGKILIGTFGTVSIIKNKKLDYIHSNILKSSDCIYFIKKIDPENILIGIPRGLIKKNLKLIGKEKIITGPGAISICKDHNSAIWIGGYNSLFNYLKDTVISSNKFDLIKGKRINSIIEDHEKKLWLGTNTGVYIINQFRNSCVPFNMKGNSSLYVNYVYEDKNFNIWIATESGLICQNNEELHILTKLQGLTENKCNTLNEDSAGNILVGTVNGLNKVDPKNFKITELRIGIFPTEVLSILKDDKNQLYFGTVNGVSQVNFKEKEAINIPPPIYINRVFVDSSKFIYPSNITARYNRKIRIEFIALNYRFSDGIEYSYNIDPGNGKWNITSNNSIEIPSLSPGNYQFFVKARLNKGDWSKPVLLNISIPVPFWKTWWAITFEICLLLTIFYLLIWWRFKTKSEKEKQEQIVLNKINYFKQQALHALINPHFIFNCMNSIQYYIHKSNTELAYKYLDQFGSLIRMTMEHAQETLIELEAELERLKIYLSLEKLRCGEKLTYKFHIDSLLDVNNIYIPNMILQPYVENAIWHGIMPKSTSGHIDIVIKKVNEEYFKIIILDDGVGINRNKIKNENHKSYGTKLTSTRLELLQFLSQNKHEVFVESNSDEVQGTKVEIILPIKASYIILE